LKLKKLANWFADEDPEKSKKSKLEQPPQQTDAKDAKLAKMQSTIAKLERDLQESHKQLAQAKAQLQINRGFQIELGETQLKLQQTVAELQRYKQELSEQQQQLSNVQDQYQKNQQALAQIVEQKTWLSLLKTPVQVIEIKKTLPKQDFETLWGFGIMSPTVETMLTTGAIFVRGWVLGKKAQAQTIRVLYQGETLLETPVDLRRPIIAQQYPDIVTAGQSGFEFSLAVTGMTTQTELNIEACLKDETIVSLCKFVLKSAAIESNDTQSSILD
jgi:multidrug efflux pump subunit AcrA (membrane-fusion protein)